MGATDLGRRVLLSVAGNIVYAANSTYGLQVIDVADPTAPRTLATLALPGPIFDLEAAGSLLYLADGKTGLTVLDVSNPAAPKLAPGIAGFPGNGQAVAEQDGYVYVSTYGQLVTVAPRACAR